MREYVHPKTAAKTIPADPPSDKGTSPLREQTQADLNQGAPSRARASDLEVTDFDAAFDLYMRDDPILGTVARSEEGRGNAEARGTDHPYLGHIPGDDREQSLDEISEPTDEEMPALILIIPPDRQ